MTIASRPKRRSSVSSISRWITVLPGGSVASQQSGSLTCGKRVPTARRTSASATRSAVATARCARKCRSEIAPLPLVDTMTGASNSSANATSSSLAPERSTPPPAMMTGDSAVLSTRAALSIASGSPVGRCRPRTGGGRGRPRGDQRVDWHLDCDRPRPPGAKLAEGFVDQSRNRSGGDRPSGVLRDGAEQPKLIRDLVQRAPADVDQVGTDLARHAQHRRVAGVGSRQACRGVQDTGTGDHGADPLAAADARVAVGHVGGRLLVAGMDYPDSVAGVVERGEEAIELHARQRKERVDPLVQERARPAPRRRSCRAQPPQEACFLIRSVLRTGSLSDSFYRTEILVRRAAREGSSPGFSDRRRSDGRWPWRPKSGTGGIVRSAAFDAATPTDGTTRPVSSRGHRAPSGST